MFENLIIRLADSLKKEKIPYMITGGQAVLLYGEPRLTKDIDITLGLGVEGLEAVSKVAKKLGLTSLVPDTEAFARRNLVIPLIHKKSGIRVDLILSFTEYERQAIQHSKKVSIKNKTVNFCSVEDLIIHKLFAGRPRDIEDIENIFQKNIKLDSNYVTKWLKILDKSSKKNLVRKFNQLLRKSSIS